MEKIHKWLLDSDPWVEFRTRIDLLNEDMSSPSVINARKKMILHDKIQTILEELQDWPGSILNNHKNTNHPIHKLSFLADLGLNKDDPPIQQIVSKIYEHCSEEGLFQVLMNISPNFGGTGKDIWAWALCDAPTILYSLKKFGIQDKVLDNAIKYVLGLIKENGWPCVSSKNLGNFRGPGKKSDPCPYATLICLKMLTQINGFQKLNQSRIAAECLLSLWEKSMSQHPFMFYMGTDFRKLKAPLFWYDILHVSDVLSQCDWIKHDKRFQSMVTILRNKVNIDGKYIPESEYRAWKGWEFSQKKAPSPFITYSVLKILKRVDVA